MHLQLRKNEVTAPLFEWERQTKLASRPSCVRKKKKLTSIKAQHPWSHPAPAFSAYAERKRNGGNNAQSRSGTTQRPSRYMCVRLFFSSLPDLLPSLRRSYRAVATTVLLHLETSHQQARAPGGAPAAAPDALFFPVFCCLFIAITTRAHAVEGPQ